MKNPVPFIHHNQTLWLSPDRCILWEEENTLIIADLHLGKSGHFRKEGIGIPQGIYKADLQRLMSQVYLFKADRLIIAGDFTHSSANKEFDLFQRWRKDFSALQIDLVLGNHDILDKQWYASSEIYVHEQELICGPFAFRHDPLTASDESNTGKYSFTGHLHPVIHLKGKGKQQLRFPCFFFGHHSAILPAFSKFTGGFALQPEKGEKVFALVDDSVMEIH